MALNYNYHSQLSVAKTKCQIWNKQKRKKVYADSS